MYNLYQEKKIENIINTPLISSNIDDNKEKKEEIFSLLESLNNEGVENKIRHSLPSYREWSNSQYSYNKNNLKSSAVTNTVVANLIKSYFNLNSLVDGKKSSRIKIRFQRLSLNRILSGKPEIKQTNDKSIITLYVYNRNKKYSFFKLKNLSIKKSKLSLIKKNSQKQNKKFYINNTTMLYTQNLGDLFNYKINKPYFMLGKNFATTPYHVSPNIVLSKNKKSKASSTLSAKMTKNKFSLLAAKKYLSLKNRKIKLINRKSLLFLNNIRKHKYLFMKALNLDNKFFNYYKNKHYNSYLKKLYKREMLYLYYIKILSVNNIKYKNWFLLGLKNIISNIYKKNVELNIVNMKYIHYNSNILTEAVSVKLKNRNNRLLKVLKKAIKLLRLPQIKSLTYKTKENSKVNNTFENNLTTSNLNNDLISIFNDIKYKTVNGVRIEAAGRLSKRLTASKSVFKYKYKGSLKDIDSSYEKTSSTISRGHVKQNIQYVKINSKTRNGAFGLKGWISSN